VDSYTDEHYDVSLSIDKDGKPKIERIYGNKRLSELKGALKVFVKAKGRVHQNTYIKISTKFT
jgi:hypothetical protein